MPSAPADDAGVSPASWGFAEDFVPLDDAISRSRQAAAGMGLEAPSGGTVSVLRLVARMVHAHAVVEIGSGAGATGLALFEGMDAAGVLTSIDTEPERQSAARQAFAAAGLKPQRFRLISGSPLDVLPKLRDGAYDLVLINGDKLEYVEYLAQALRLLRHGGVVVMNDALWHNLVADEGNDDDETLIIREALQSVQDTDEFTSALLPVGNGLLVAVKG
ncbi:MAG TPA: class I SAM-dependent methyltransferase [Propionibacteriaceae bacterium]|nr:class I SAM-dependent methyltransferase [Propionibacteriaceae bacterium]